jgi:twitching motility protein PilT
VDRIIDQFPPDQQEQIRVQLSVSVIAVISQVLMPSADSKGRVAGFEIMVMNSAIENHIRKNETFKITSVIQTNRSRGMILLDEHLLRLYREGRITREEAILKAQLPGDLRKRMDYNDLGAENGDEENGTEGAGPEEGGRGGIFGRKKSG